MQATWGWTARSIVLSILLHLSIGVVLIYSFDFTPKPTPPQKPIVNIVKAAAVDKKQVELELARLKRQEDEKIAKAIERQKNLEKQADAAKKRRQQEEKRLDDIKKQKAQEEAQIKKLALEKKRKQAAEQKKKDDERKRKQAAEQKKKDDERKRKQAAEQKKKDDERKRKQAAEKKRLAQEKALQDQLDAELKAAQQARDNAILAKYMNLIQNDISNNFNLSGLPQGLSCVILIRMLEGGNVVEAVIVKSSGNDLFDRRAQKAVYSASPLPVPSEPRLFEQMRNIRFTFKP